ncbi:MAG: trypsin-like peptidase domain-containing protein [Blastocatellia bacterium]|nr:trypsin-like peptidase domain-containing protein [Blastocatellia bacterium]
MTGEGRQIVIRISPRTFWLLAGVVVLFGVGVALGWRLAGIKTPGEGKGATVQAAWWGGNPPPLDLAIVRVAESVEPAVVHITTVDTTDGELGQGTGSGFVVDSAGYLVTNYHVVQGASRIKVKFNTGVETTARFIAADEETDLAVLKVDSRSTLQSVVFGDSDSLRVGDWVVAIGSPFGLDQTVTAGIISAKERVTDRRRSLQQFLQTDAAINPGNSGGPLLNLSGEVVGINAQIATQDGRFNGISFAIPSSTAKEVYRQLISQGRVSRGYLGVFLDRVTPQFAKIYNIPRAEGAMVQYVDDYGPARNAGLGSGDVVVEFDGRPIRTDRDLIRFVAATPVGKTVDLKYYRDGHLKKAEMLVEERLPPEAKNLTPVAPKIRRKNPNEPLAADPLPPRKLGLVVGTLSRMRLQQFGLTGAYDEKEKGAIVVAVDPAGVAFEARVRERDVIVALNRKPIENEEDFNQALKMLKSNDDVVFEIKRINSSSRRVVTNFVSFTLP